MNAPIVAARGNKSGWRGIAKQLGKGPVIGVAIVAVIVATLLARQVLPHHGSASRDANVTQQTVLGPAVSTAQYYDDLMTQQEDYIHRMATRAMLRQTAAQYDDLMAQQDDFLHTMAARADARLTIPSEQQRFLEQNTITLPSVAGAPATTTEQRECTHPTIGFPTCYSLQGHSTWAREELVDTDTLWVVVGTVTFDEMMAAIGEVTARIP